MAGRNFPVRIRGVVTYYDPTVSRLLFVQEEEGQGIYVNPYSVDWKTFPIAAGTLVELEGRTSRGTLYPAVFQPRVKVLGEAPFPSPKKVPLAGLMEGEQDCQWIETEGVVRNVSRIGDLVALTVADQQALIPVTVQNFPEARYRDLVDARIQIQGVLGTHSNVNRQIIKVQIFVPTGRQIRILKPPAEDPYSLPIQSVASLQKNPRGSLPSHRLHLQGKVFPLQLGNWLLFQDASGSLEVYSKQTTPLSAGNFLDVVGFPVVRENKLVLEDSSYRHRTSLPFDGPTEKPLLVLSDIVKVRQLNNQEAAQGYPVLLQGVVTYFNDEASSFFLEGRQAGIIVEVQDSSIQLGAGQRIELEGRTVSGEVSPLVVAQKIRLVGASSLPAARPATVDRFFHGETDCLRVELEGMVRTVYGDSNHACLELINGRIRFRATLPGFSGKPLPLTLVDSRVRIRGSAGVQYNFRRQISGYQLYTPDIRDITVTEPGPDSPFSLPVRPIQNLLRFSPGDASGHRVRIRGVVLHNKIGEFLYLRDPSGTIYIQTRQEMGILPGTPIDVVGFPAMGNPANILEDAIFQWPLPAQELSIQNITSDQALSGHFHGDLVRLQADLISLAKTSTGQILLLKAGDTIFEAALDGQGAAIMPLEAGCRLELTGICLIKTDLPRRLSFQILLRTNQDIRLVRSAPFWTPVRMAWILGLFLLGILISSVWGIALRRRVRQQTGIIRQRLEREAALENEYRDLIENSNDVVFSFDLDGKITSINKAGEKLLSYPRRQLTEMTFERLLVPERIPLARQKFRQAMEGAPAAPFEIELQAKDGRRITLEVTAEVRVREGQPAAVRGIGRDITRRKQAETALRASEERLRETLKLEAIGTLAGGIAHDFNNILSAILGYAELALMEIHNSNLVSDSLHQIHKAGRRARDLVRQILTFSRKLPQERNPILIQPLLEDAAKLLRATLPATIELRLDIQPGCQPILADSSQIHQVIMNLGTNAFHAMRSSGGRLEFRLQQLKVEASRSPWHPELPEGEYNCLTVIDSGHGIDPETLNRIFDPYFTTKPYGDGSGLGLAVVHGIVQSYQGGIQVESQLGRGTTFRICLPCYEDTAVEPEVEKEDLSGGKESILFVDDEEALVKMMGQSLGKLGYAVTTMTSSLSALAAFQQSPQVFDLVITDQTMPHMTGIHLTRELKKIRPGLPIILCTGYSEEATPEKALMAGVTVHLYKPVSIHDLAKAIQRAASQANFPSAV
jgi:PAS domain S-box-containing protein